MKEFIIAIGLVFFVEGLFLAIFPSRIKSILELIKNTPENQLRFYGIVFLINSNMLLILDGKMAKNRPSTKKIRPIAIINSFTIFLIIVIF